MLAEGIEPRASSDLVYDCIIVGAGASGLTLGRELTQPPAQNLKKRRVLVLEAGSRIGGRIRTDRRSFGHPVELGAEYVHMPPLEAALWREVDRYQLPLRRVDKMDGADMSGEEYLRADAAARDEVEQDFKRMIVSGHLGALEHELSMRGFTSDHISEQLKSTKEYYIEPGYDRLLDGLARGLDVRLEQKVRRIVATTPELEVETEAGDVFRAKSVAITASVGVLKGRADRVHPRAPEAEAGSLGSSRHELPHQGPHRGRETVLARGDEHAAAARPLSTRGQDLLRALPGGRGKSHADGADHGERFRADPLVAPAGDPAQHLFGFERVLPRGRRHVRAREEEAERKAVVLADPLEERPRRVGRRSFIKYRPSSPLAPESVHETYASCAETPGLFWAGEAAAIFEQASSVHGAHSAALLASLEIQSFLEGKPVESPKDWAPLYHQLYGLQNEMKWYPHITREPVDPRESEDAWQERTEALIRGG